MQSGRGEGQQRRVQSIEVGFRVVRVLQAAKGPLPLREIAASAGMPPSKAHLYLVSFVREGIAEQDSRTGYYGLGPLAIQLGLAAISQLDVVDLAREELAFLRTTTGCAAYLSLWGDLGPAIVSKEDGDNQGAFALRLGYHLPMTGSATGLVFLAYLSEAQLAKAGSPKWEGPAGETLSARLKQVRADGYASTKGVVNANFAAFAAPVFDYGGHMVAGLTVLGSDRFMSGPRVDLALESLLVSARRLSQRLGAKAAAPD